VLSGAGAGAPSGFARLLAFAAVAGLGLTADVLLYAGLVVGGTHPGTANAAGAVAGLTICFFISIRRVFGDNGCVLAGKFTVWLAWQAVLVSLASVMVAWLAQGLGPAWAKVLVTPATFLANYAAMSLISWKRASSCGIIHGPFPRPRILAFVPMYNCERQLPRVLARFPAWSSEVVDEMMVVDNGSRDRSCEAASAALDALPFPARVVRNRANLNLGGSHKVAFDAAIAGGFDWVLVVHGDDQADVNDMLPRLRQPGWDNGLDAILGSRFSRGSRRLGYAWHRVAGNLAFNVLFSLATLRRIADLGSGLNLFSTAWLAQHDHFYRRLPDDLTFNNHLVCAFAAYRARVAWHPISWREEDQVSNVRLVRQGLRTLGIASGYAIRRAGYLAGDRSGHPPAAYACDLVTEHRPVLETS
jgi:putative flippase GtrA